MNPIIPGFAPDPTIIRVEDTFYAVNSSFHIFPCLPVFASKNLVDWEHIGNAINNRKYITGKLSLAQTSTRISPEGEWSEPGCFTSGLWAPTIRHHAGTFYVICTNVLLGDTPQDERRHNFLVSTHDPFSDNWSAPVFLTEEMDGQDPGLFFEANKAYVHFSAVPHPPSPWTSINMFELDVSTGAKLGAEVVLWKGTGGIYIEGPHIYAKDGWYYLFVSEGGCFPDHMITAARSRELFGPYEAAATNPVLPPAEKEAYVQHTGHGDLVQDQGGQWWSIALGVRKDDGGRYNMGRETFLTPVSWPTGEFPRLDPVEIDPPTLAQRAEASGVERTIKVAKEGVDLCYIRDTDLSRHKISGDKIVLTPDVGFFTDVFKATSFVGKRQRKHTGTASVRMKLDGQTTGRAGFAVYKDEHRFLCVCIDFEAQMVEYQAFNRAKKIDISQKSEKLAIDGAKAVKFMVDYTEKEYTFSYQFEGGESLSGRFASFDTIGLTGFDFVGPILGVFAVKSGSGGKAMDVVFEKLEVM